MGADHVHGSATAVFKELDLNSNGKLTLGELQEIAREPNGFSGSVEALFDCLDINGASVLTENDIRFLDRWDLVWDECTVIARKHSRKASIVTKERSIVTKELSCE